MSTPIDPAAEELHERARRSLKAGDAAGARRMLEQLVAIAPRQIPYWLSLAAVHRALGLRAEDLSTLEQALALDPTHPIVLLQKAAVLDLMDKPRSAAAVYTHALHSLPAGARLPPGVEAHVAHARKRVAANSAELAAAIEQRLSGLTQAADCAAERMRFDRCLDRLLGRTRIYASDPTFMLFPFLINYEFSPREYFPWLESLEESTADIRSELLAVLSADESGIVPYIARDQGLPMNQWSELNHSRRWGAYFLWSEGRRDEAHLARCPRTAAALSALPQVDIPRRGPTAFFSILEPHTKIPPHTGSTNTRLTVHLPLIVPGGCRFRVGGETREWRLGSAWVFDDTIEHEAWNDSDQARAILIFDVWNPQLTSLERDLVREATATLVDFADAESPQPEYAN
jgi:aspartate beta-hydroxylase